MNRILSMLFICYAMLLTIGNSMANQAVPLPMPINNGGQQAIPLPHPIDGGTVRPLTPPKQRLHNEIGLLLVEDELTSQQYVTTLDSRGNRMAGNTPQAIFGFPNPAGQMKPLTWYTHGTNNDVQHIIGFTPAEAFAGVTDAHGSALLQGNTAIDIPPSGPVNPVFSAKAWDEFSKMPVGGSHAISVTELLTNGGERRLDTLVAKRAHLRLAQANPDCKPEIVEGVEGQVCTLRTITGQHQATSAGDVRFTVKTQSPMVSGRFRIANNWHRLGEPVTIAEFANGRTLDLFLPSNAAKEGGSAMRMALRFEAQFFSLSRQGMGDKLSVRMDQRHGAGPQPPVLGRVDLLLIEDIPTARQYVTTLRSSGQQVVFGEQQGPRGVSWYTIWQQGMSALNPLVRVSQLQPANYFRGVANATGQLSQSIVRPAYEKGYIYPVFSDEAFSALRAAPVGRQQRLALLGEYNSGINTPYYLNVNKNGHIRLQMPVNNQCHPQEVDGHQGQVCPVRELQTEGHLTGNGDIRLLVQAKMPYAQQQQARYGIGGRWFKLTEHLSMAELQRGGALELFIPAPQEEGIAPASYAVTTTFYSQSRNNRGDHFALTTPTRLSPAANMRSTLYVMPIQDLPSGNTMLTTVNPHGVMIGGVVGRNASALAQQPSLRLLGMPTTRIQTAQPAHWFTPTRDVKTAALPLTNVAISALQQQENQTVQLKVALQNGQQSNHQLNIKSLAPLRFEQPASVACRTETVEGVAGQVCELRRISGQAAAADMRFLLNAKLPYALQQKARYQAGNVWYPLGKSIGLAELAKSQNLSLFVPQDQNAAAEVYAVQAELYSPQDSAQQLILPMSTPLSPDAKSASSQQLLVVEDRPTNKTLFAPPLAASPRLSGSPAVAVTGGATPLVSLTGLPGAKIQSISPQEWLLTEKTRQQPSHLPLSAQAVAQLLEKGRLHGQVSVALPNGGSAEYPLAISTGQRLLLSEGQTPCQPETVNGVQGKSCEWRRVSGEIKQSDLRFRVTTNGPVKENIFYKIGDKWHRIDENISISEFTDNKSLHLFIPDQLNRKLTDGNDITSSINGEIYSYHSNMDRLTFKINYVDDGGNPQIVDNIELDSDAIRVGEKITVTVKLRGAPGNNKMVYNASGFLPSKDLGYCIDRPNFGMSDFVGGTPITDATGAKFIRVDEGVDKFSYKLYFLSDIKCPRYYNVDLGWQHRVSKSFLVLPKDYPNTPLVVNAYNATFPSGYVTLSEGDEFNVQVSLNRPADASENIYVIAPIGAAFQVGNKYLSQSITNLNGANYVSGTLADGIKLLVNPGRSEFSFTVKLKGNFGEASLNGENGMIHLASSNVADGSHVIVFATAKNDTTQGELVVAGYKSDAGYDPNTHTSYIYAVRNKTTRIYAKLNRPARQGGESVDLLGVTGGSASTLSYVYPITKEVFGTKTVPINGADGVLNIPTAINLTSGAEAISTVNVPEGVSELSFDLLPLSSTKNRYVEFGATSGIGILSYTFIVDELGQPEETEAKVLSVNAAPDHVEEGGVTTFTVTMDKPALGTERVNLQFVAGTADRNDLASTQIGSLTGATGSIADITAAGQSVQVKAGMDTFTFTLQTKDDADTTDETFELLASEAALGSASPKKTVTIRPKQDSIEVKKMEAFYPSSGKVPAGEKVTFKVTLTGPAPSGGQDVAIKILPGLASASSDFDTPALLELSNILAEGSITNLDAGGFVTVNPGYNYFYFKVKTKQDADTNIEDFSIYASTGRVLNPQLKGTTIEILPFEDPQVRVVSVAATPNPVKEGTSTKVTIKLDKPAIGGEEIFIKFSGVTAQSDDIVNAIVPGLSQMTGATGQIADLERGGFVSADKDATEITFSLPTTANGDLAEESFLLLAKEKQLPTAGDPFVQVVIQPNLVPKIGFTNDEPGKSGVFGIGSNDILFNYGVQLINYMPSSKLKGKTDLEGRLLRALSIKVDVSGIKSYNPGTHDYCAFETIKDKLLVPFPFFLQQESGAEIPIDCSSVTSLSLSAPESWTGVQTGTTYNTTLKAKVVMGDPISQNASGLQWHGSAQLNGTLTLNMQAN